MKSYGSKPNIKLTNGQTILERQIDILDRYFSDFTAYIILGHNFKKERKKIDSSLSDRQDIHFLINQQYEEQNVTGSIKKAIKKCNNDGLLILYADLVFTSKIFKNIKFNRSKVFIEKERYLNKKSVGCIIGGEDILEHMIWDLSNKWCQIVFFTGKELEILKNQEINPRSFLYELINKIGQEGNFLVEKINGGLIDIDKPKDIEIARKIIK